MHELGIVFHIMDSLEEVGKENRLTEISSVTLEIGQVSTIVDTCLLECWKWACGRSELLRGAELLIEEIPAVTFCENCGKTYDTVAHGRICPLCGSEKTVLVQGNEVNIKEIRAC
ncbi:MAG: hydrogenase maturation nickel metallochaperone HypA [Emergencia sp.]